MDGYIAVGELWAPLGEKGGLKMYESGHFLEKMSISIGEKELEGKAWKSRYRNKRWVSESQYNFSVRYIYVPEYICRFLQHASNETSEFDITSLVGMNTAVIGLYRHSGFCNEKVFWNTYYNCLMKYIINTYRLYLGEQNDSILAQY